jgi:hypothetical protein
MRQNDRPMVSSVRRALAVALLGAGACGLLSACATVPPTYTEAELRAQCERRGGWWRGSLIPGYCEFQAASAGQAP